ncbi:unnamed protein product, partial [Rotaria socialis]
GDFDYKTLLYMTTPTLENTKGGIMADAVLPIVEE